MNTFYDRLPVPLQNAACTFAGFQRYRQRFTTHFDRVLRAWSQTVDGPAERLHAYRLRRLRRMIGRARSRVPYYRELPPPVDAADPAEAIRRTLARIEPLEKSTYRDHLSAFLRSDLPRSRLMTGMTSGTTGTALRLFYTPSALAEEYVTVWRMREACGVSPDDPHMTFGGRKVVPFFQDRPPFWRRDRFQGQTLFSLHHMTPRNLPAYVDEIHRSDAVYVQGYPSSLYVVGRALLDAGRPVPPGRLRAVFTSSESLLAFHREVIEKAFGAPVRDRYGTSELCVSMTACDADRLHVDMEFSIVEVEVEERGEDWERGPLLVTGLSNDATPFFRYRVGDIGTRSTRECPCGRPGDVFLNVDGRIEDYVVTPDGRMIGRLDHIFKGQHDVAEAQILQERPEAIEVRLVPRPGWTSDSERALRREIRSRLGDEIRVELTPVEAIEREANGKFRLVKSRVGRDAVEDPGPEPAGVRG